MREYDGLLLSRPEDGILLVTLNRPDRFNALTFGMFDEIKALCRDLEGDADTRAVVLTGAGHGFCGGLDLDEVGRLFEMSPQEFMRGQENWAGVSLALRRLGLLLYSSSRAVFRLRNAHGTSPPVALAQPVAAGGRLSSAFSPAPFHPNPLPHGHLCSARVQMD